MRVRKMMQFRKIFWAAAIVLILYLLIIYSRGYSQIDERDRRYRLAQIDQFIKSHVRSDTCKFPDLPVNSSEMLSFIRYEPPIDCSSAEPDWVIVEGSICKISDFARNNYQTVTCTFQDLIRVDDYNVKEGDSVILTDSSYTLRNSDVAYVYCHSPQTSIVWKSVLIGIRQDPDIANRPGWSKLPRDALNYNVLMFGFDSLSRNTFIRKLPQTYKYLTEILGAKVLKGYNIVGDGTPQALIPILTGKTELELPDTRKRIPKTSHVDVYPFVWKDFRKNGYVTAFYEDLPQSGTFTYRLRGFEEVPTDHYMRPYYTAARSLSAHSPKLCFGSTPRHKVMMNHIKNFFTSYRDKPKFLFAFHGELSHDSYNLIGVADDDVKQFLVELNEGGYLHDTILILMADHGHRFAEIRNTIQGKQEERLPFFSFTFPPSFEVNHEQAFKNFVKNTNRLVTPFDIYPTLKSVLSLGNTGPADLKQRSVSLFSQISEKRSCSDAYIEPHWCACLDWHEISPDSQIIPKLTAAFIDKLNAFTESYRNLCEPLVLKKLIWATQLSPNDNFLRFKKNADYDGFVPDLSSGMKIDSNLYQIKVQLIPGNSLFESSITHFINENKFEVKMTDISRINMYGRQARCIEDEYPQLRKYCYCKDSL